MVCVNAKLLSIEGNNPASMQIWEVLQKQGAHDKMGMSRKKAPNPMWIRNNDQSKFEPKRGDALFGTVSCIHWLNHGTENGS